MGRMYKTDADNDGFSALKLYIAQLNPSILWCVFLVPKSKWDSTDSILFENRPLGVKKDGNTMKFISFEQGRN